MSNSVQNTEFDSDNGHHAEKISTQEEEAETALDYEFIDNKSNMLGFNTEGFSIKG